MHDVSGFDILNSVNRAEDDEAAKENADAPELEVSDDEDETLKPRAVPDLYSGGRVLLSAFEEDQANKSMEDIVCDPCADDSDDDGDTLKMPRKSKCCGGQCGHDCGPGET